MMSTVGVLVAGLGVAHADETRALDAHVHGVGALELAIEGDVVQMRLEAPGADIVGFEHPAETPEDKAAIETAKLALSMPLELFVVSDLAGCRVTTADVSLLGDEDHDDHDDHGHDDQAHNDHDHAGHDDHDDHADHDDHDDHAHDDHADHAHDDHADHADHADHDDHDHSGDGADHTAFVGEYSLTCSDVQALGVMEFVYFEVFPNALELDVQTVSASGAQAFEVTRAVPNLDLSALY
ncbi:MAG: DUF2796 domain-containing protein [Marinibacterium sp.]|nr:DUF2796 domain-containing protein [Marinibacterium sp.]